MEIKLNAVMLKGVDYKDNDKMLTLYSLERGVIGAGVKGVKRAGAKLGFCAQPFCFAEYVLTEKSGRCTVIGATELESFYKLRLNVEAYYCACVISEFTFKCAGEEGISDEPLFLLLVNALKTLNFGGQPPKEALSVFMLNCFSLMGYAVSAAGCDKCRSSAATGEYAYFDFATSKLYCEECAPMGATKIYSSTAQALENAVTGNRIDPAAQNALLKFLSYYTELKTGEKLTTIGELLKL